MIYLDVMVTNYLINKKRPVWVVELYGNILYRKILKIYSSEQRAKRFAKKIKHKIEKKSIFYFKPEVVDAFFSNPRGLWG